MTIRMQSPPPMRAAIDIGSNTIHIVVARCTVHDLEIVEDEQELVRIGESVTASGEISPEKMKAAIAVLKRYKALSRKHKADPILVVATEAIRQASNSEAFLEEVFSKTKLTVNLISGTAEAAFTFLGSTYEVFKEPHPPAEVGVMDLGGGSMELVTARNMRIIWKTSLAVGSGWLHDRYLTANPPTYDDVAVAETFLETYFRGLQLKQRPPILIVTGGSANSILFLARNAFKLDVSQNKITQEDLMRCQGLLISLPAEEIAERFEQPIARARILLAGALIIQAVMARLHIDAIQVSSHGIREGVLLAYERYKEQWLEVVNQSAEALNHKLGAQSKLNGLVAYTPEEEPFAQSGQRLLQERMRKMLEWPKDVLKHEDVEAVHKMRVAIRRLRATLDAYQSICDPKSFKKIYRQVTQIADVLGAARDTDVMLLNLQAQLEEVKSEDKAGVEWIMQRLQTFREQKQLELESFLKNLDEDDLRKQIELCIQEGVVSNGKS